MTTAPLDALDALFAARGLTPATSARGANRTWTGRIGDRSVHVVCSLRRRTVYHGEIRSHAYEGHEFLIEVGTRLRTRLTATSATPGNRVARLLDRLLMPRVGLVPLETPDPAYAHLKLAAFEPPWARALLADEHVRHRITRTLVPPDESGALFAFQPAGIVLTRRRRALGEITPGYAQGLLDALLAVADVAESIPAPTHVVAPTRFERTARERPKAFVAMLFGVMFGAVLAVSAIVLPLLFLVAYFRLQGWVLVAGLAGWFWWRRNRKRAARSPVPGR